MHGLLCILILQLIRLSYSLDLSHANNNSDLAAGDLFPSNNASEQLQLIQNLQKEKDTLYVKIVKEIEDSLQHLNGSNSTDFALYMVSLLRHVENLNASVGRRSLQQPDLSFLGKDAKLFDMEKIYGNKKKNPERWEKRYQSRLEMQKRMDEWIQKRLEEKAKLNKYKHSLIKERAEKCPRQGVGDPKKKKSGRRQGSRGNGKPVYPCCRKCCKRSYMGCL